MELLWDIKSLEFIEPEEHYWWQNKPYIEQLVELLERNNHLKQIRYINIADKYYEVKDITDILLRVKQVKKKSFSFELVEDKNDNGKIRVYLTDEMINIQFVVENKPLSKKLIGQVKKTTIEIYQQFKDIAVLGPGVYITFLDFDFPRFRPIRKINFGNTKSVLEFVDSRFYENKYYCHLKMKNMEKLYTESLPAGCTREKVDDFYILSWTENFDEENIRKALMQKEEWLYQVLTPPVRPEFNELGDEQGVTVLPGPHEVNTFFTAFNDLLHIGYKAITLTKENDFDPEVKKQLIHYIKEGQLENGDPLERIYLIVPTRERAVAIQEKAREIGITNIYYIDNDGDFWDICPTGNWRENS